ncbi:MAG: cation:proton antiporter [Planctomycetes bacterium]|nr:cation:proton antiporter [Planctomycetota bacterium]
MQALASAVTTHYAFLVDIGVVLGAGVAASILMAGLRLPAVTGLLLAGALCGPFGLALVSDLGTIDSLAEIGVVLLLFTIGLEFPLSRFLRIGKPLIVGGTLQVAFTVAAAVAACLLLGMELNFSLPVAFAVALSSTAIVLRGLSDRGEVDAPHGRLIVGTLLYQDLCVIPMMLVLPVLAGEGSLGGILRQAAVSLGLALGAVVVTYVISRLVLPVVLARVDRTRSRESFILSILAICLAIALATDYAGLSLALGAFLAGVVIADSPYANRALTDVIPLRDVLTGLFFISLGMMFDGRTLVEKPLLVVGIFAAMVVGKTAIAAMAAMLMRIPGRVAVLYGLALAQFGEFGFVLLKQASTPELRLFDMTGDGRWLWSAALLTMFVTPLVLRFSPHLAAGARILRPLERLLGIKREVAMQPVEASESAHVIIAGYGVTGRNLASTLEAVGIPFVVLELNADNVMQARREGRRAIYGDVTAGEALHHAHIERASAFVLTINDPGAVGRVLDNVRRHAPAIPVIVRCRYASEREHLLKLGATEVVTLELEGTVEILARVLRLLAVPRNLIDREVALVRERTELSAREVTVPRHTLGAVADLGALKVESFLLEEGNWAVGRTLADIGVRTLTGALVIATRRPGHELRQPQPAEALIAGELLYLVGSLAQTRDTMLLLQTGSVPAQDAISRATRKIVKP